MTGEEAPLYEDIKAMDMVSREIALTGQSPSTGAPSALERGERFRPDGTREVYERAEFFKPEN